MDLLAAGTGLLPRVALYLLVFWPTVGYVVYYDARRRGLSRPLARAIALGFLGIVGLVVHLWTREDPS